MVLKKWCAVICLFLICAISGCALTGGQYPDQGKTAKDNKVMEGFEKNVASKDNNEAGGNADQAEKFSTEVRHWKYGTENNAAAKTATTPVQSAAPSITTADIDNNKTISMQFLTVEDIDRIQTILVKKGYLKTKTRDETLFNQAVADFQKAHQLEPTGELDASTLACFNQVK